MAQTRRDKASRSPHPSRTYTYCTHTSSSFSTQPQSACHVCAYNVQQSKEESACSKRPKLQTPNMGGRKRRRRRREKNCQSHLSTFCSSFSFFFSSWLDGLLACLVVPQEEEGLDDGGKRRRRRQPLCC